MPEKLPEVTLILFGSTIVILLLVGLIVLSLFINQKRKFRYRQDSLAMKNDFDQALLRSQLEIQAQAFESISRELHDNVGTLISIAMVHIGSLGNNDSLQEKVLATESLLNEAMDTLRDISRSIHPENISKLGWQQSFKAELERVRKTNLFDIVYGEEGEPFPVEIGKQVIIFRILQESLNNIVKHSDARHIWAAIRFEGSKVIIQIQDDGKGIGQVAEHIAGPGSGIRNMQARAAMLPAILKIENRAPAGTRLTLIYGEETSY